MDAPSISGRRVLIVEDEAMVAMLIEDMLDELGCLVVGTVARVEPALECLAANPIEIAVLDVNLRGEFSYPVADALAARGIPFLFITGYGQQGLSDEYRDRPVLQKPFTRDILEQALADLAG